MGEPINYYYGDSNYYRVRCDDGGYLIFSADNEKSVHTWLGNPLNSNSMAHFFNCDPCSLQQIEESEAISAPHYRDFLDRYKRLQVSKIDNLEVRLAQLGKISSDDALLDTNFVYLKSRKIEEDSALDYYFACRNPSSFKRWLSIKSAELCANDLGGFENNYDIVSEEEVRNTENYTFFLKTGCSLSGFTGSNGVFVLGRKLE